MDKETWAKWITDSGFLAPLIRFTEQFEAIYEIIHIAGIVLGALVILWTIISFMQRKRSGADNGAGTRLGWGLVGGSLMIQLFSALKAVSGTFWTTSDLPSPMQYADSAAESAADPIKASLYISLGLLVLIGWVIGLRSCYKLSQVGDKIGHGDGTGEFWKAATSLIFSSVLVNMQYVADGLAASFTDTTFTTTFGL